LAFAIADLWSDWPVCDASTDLVLNIFAPRNFTKAARVLRPGGWFGLIYPEANHLIELRRPYRLLDQHGEKARRYREAASRTIGPAAVTRIVRHTTLVPDAVQRYRPDGTQYPPSRNDTAARRGGADRGHLRHRRPARTQAGTIIDAKFFAPG
jgi:hypothetical protein